MKTTTKLVLGATMVAGLSMSAFAACATNVDFGGSKKLENLADGINPGDSVNYGQVMDVTTVVATETNATQIAHRGTLAFDKITFRKVGKMVCVNGRMSNVSGADLAVGEYAAFNVPAGMAPASGAAYFTAVRTGTETTTLNEGYVYNGRVWFGIGEPLPHNTSMSMHVCYPTL